MTDQIPPAETQQNVEPTIEIYNSAVTSSITPLHAPVLEGWPPSTSHSYTPQPLAVATNSTQDNFQDVEMTDVTSSNENKVNTASIDASPLITTPLPDVNGLSTKATAEGNTIASEKSSNITIVLNTGHARDPSSTIAISKSRNSTPSRAVAVDNNNNDTISNGRTSSSQHMVTTASTTAQVMPKEAPSNGAPTRRYLNENVTGVLLEGMKMIVKERPSNPLKALGEYLIQRSEEINYR